MANPREGFSGLARIVFGTVKPEPLERALEFSSLPRMRELEAQGYFEDPSMRPGNPRDPDSFKVRRAEVGAWTAHLSGASRAFVAAELARLDPTFGYR